MKPPKPILTREEIQMLIEKSNTEMNDMNFSVAIEMSYMCASKIKNVSAATGDSIAVLHDKFRRLLELCDIDKDRGISFHSIRLSRMRHIADDMGIKESDLEFEL